MSLFRKPKKNIQRRVFSENPDEDDVETRSSDAKHVEGKAHKGENRASKLKPEPKKQNLLSFETEEEGEVFQVKKSSYSKKMMRMYEKERKRKEAKEASAKLKGDESSNKHREIITDDLIVVVNHKVPTPSPPPPPILSGRDALCAGKNDLSSEDEDDHDTTHRFSKPDNFRRVLESGAIPDAAMIHAARKKRQKARELGGDFIPIDDEDGEDKGRMARDDENDDDVSDNERIDMGANPVKRDQERRREQFNDAQGSDQEVNEWEDQQIRKGVTGVALNQELVYHEYSTHSAPFLHPAKSTPKFEAGVQPPTPESILERLREQYHNATTEREIQMEKLEKVRCALLTSAEELEKMKIEAPKAAERYRFYQELRGYVTDLVECLDEKVGIMNELEQRAIELMTRKSEWLIERRRQDVRDQADEVTSLSKRALGQKAPEDSEKMRRAVEREGRRTRRRRARETSGEPRHVEGMSSDDEVPQQTTLQFDNERDQLQAEVSEVLDDVVEDFSSITSVLIHFEKWRETDMVAYEEAFATLCLPKVVSPLIRLDLIFWDPLNDTFDLEKADWYRTIALYGLHDDETESSLGEDPDLQLLPTIFDKVIVPKIAKIVEKCWDPISSTQTLRLVGIIGRYIRKYPSLRPESKSLNSLFSIVLDKLKLALEHDVFIPIMPRFAETKNPFFQRQFACGLKLLRNITSWQGLLNDRTLKELAITSLLNRYLISAVKICKFTDAVAKAQLISIILPRVWLAGEKAHLQMFTTCILQLAQQVDKENPLHIESGETLSTILKTLK